MAGVVLDASLFEPGVSALDLWDLPSSHRQGPVLLNVLHHLDLPQAVALVAPRKVTIRAAGETDRAVWEWPIQLQKALGGNGLAVHVVGE
jgi:ABC-type antimicrobial peptide transport system permease subunit